LKWYDEGEENHIKGRFLKSKCFSPLRILTSPLFEENKSSCVEKYLAPVGMCMSLMNLSIFIQLQSISKSRFSRNNTNSDITPPNHLDMVTFEILLA
jgi:hypothetical protein